MGDFFARLFTSDFLPHGNCFFWEAKVLWLHVISDAIICLSYYSIPIALVCIVRKREDLAFNWMFVLFAAFIFACGTTHLFDVWTVWHGTYRIVGIFKALCAAISAVTAIRLWPLIPKIVHLPSVKRLEQEITERTLAEESLLRARLELEEEVRQRTKDLMVANEALRKETEIFARFHNVTVDREHEMIRLKREANGLLRELGRMAKYDDSFIVGNNSEKERISTNEGE